MENISCSHTITAQLVIDDNPEAFEALHDQGESIEAQVQGDVEWHPIEDSPERSNRTRITVTRDAAIKDEDRWPEYHDWLLQRRTGLHDALGSRVRSLDV